MSKTTEKIIIEAWERGDFRIDFPSMVCILNENIESHKRNHELNYSQSEYDKAYKEGYEEALDNNNILHGEDAERFLKETGLDKLRD